MRLLRALERRSSIPTSCATRQENKKSRQLIADGEIGRVYHARVQYHYRERGVDYEPPPGREWLYRWGLKGGALGQHGSHYLDQAWFLMGCPQPAMGVRRQPQRVSDAAQSRAPLRRLHEPSGGLRRRHHNSDGHIGCHFHLGRSSVGPAVYASWAPLGRSKWNPTRLPAGQKRSGTRRLLGAIYTEGDNFVDEYVEHGSGEFRCGRSGTFAAAIRGEQPPDVSPADALTFMKLLDAIYLSAQTGEKVQVAE